MIETWIREALGNLWGDVAYYATFAFLDPWWGMAAWLATLYVVVMLVCWFFGALWPTLRWIGGIMLIVATFGLYAYSRGEKDARAHDAARAPKPRAAPVPSPRPQEPWKWPFS